MGADTTIPSTSTVGADTTTPSTSTVGANVATSSPLPSTSAAGAQTTAADESLNFPDDRVSPVNLAEGIPVPALIGEEGSQAVLVQDSDGDAIAIDLHPAAGELSIDETEVVIPEAPVTFSQVLTYVELQATSEEREQLRRVLGRPSAAPRTRNVRVQVDFRPLVRQQAVQAGLRPRVTRLPGGGVVVEGADFSFRHSGVAEETDFNF